MESESDGGSFRLASFGFLLPHKGLEQLLEAVAILLANGRDVTLNMLNAEYPAEVSREAIKAISSLIKDLGLEQAVTLDTTYYSDEECLQRLCGAHLVVFPYQSTLESSSAAVRHGIASGASVAVTPLAIFEDVAPAVLQLPGTEPSALAAGIEERMAWGYAERHEFAERRDAWMNAHTHSVVAARLTSILRALVLSDN
jgi:glycosyltransferase involved in cell wall biosynthesis